LFFHRRRDSNRFTLGGDPSVETAALHHLDKTRELPRAAAGVTRATAG
jgi:hypothetical protein